MPVYEYYCPTCKDKFEVRRSISEMDDPAVCAGGHADTWRTLSMFTALVSRGEFGEYEGGSDFGSFEGGGCACGGSCSCGG
ncbi:MAG: zinc ribbon domain-containing protein [Dehalococcoidia bacterium]|nr:zinc ribbon domain-containing protein [Dehalococcoidia bacterium]